MADAQQRVVGGGHKHVWVGGKRLGAGGQFLGGAAHHRDVHLVALQHRYQLVAVAHRQTYFNAFVLALELCQQARQKVFGRAHHANGQRAHLQLLQPRSGVFGVFQGGQHFPGVDQHVFTRCGQRHFAPAAFEQGEADVPFQLFDLHRDGRWREVHGFGRTRKTEVACHLSENPELTEGGVFHSVIA